MPLAVAAWFVLTMRDPHRFVIGILGAAALWFVIFYADISGLPIPTGLKNIFQVMPLPTYVYDFQFAVNTDPPQTLQVLGLQSGSLALVTFALALAVMYAASTRRSQRLDLLARARTGPRRSRQRVDSGHRLSLPEHGARTIDSPRAGTRALWSWR